MLDPDLAWQALLPHLSPLPSRRVRRSEARALVLAAPLTAREDLPALTVSAMDGFALSGAAEPGSAWHIAGVLGAGVAPGQRLAAGETVRIMTGAPLPDGADRVLPVEEAAVDGMTMRPQRTVEVGAHVRKAGEIVRTGAELLPAGTRLTPSALALLAAQGFDSVPVHARPRVAFLSTGNEVVPAEAAPGPGQLRDSHGDFLEAACATLGIPLERLGIVDDEPAALREAIGAGLDTDVLLVSGGVSQGIYDYVPRCLEELGCTTIFHRLAMRPGKPLLAARHGRGLVFGLPGNPASVQTGTWLFVLPALRRLAGERAGFWGDARPLPLDGHLPAGAARERFVPACWSRLEGGPAVRPLTDRGSHDLATWGRAEALIRVRREDPARGPGETCEALALPG